MVFNATFNNISAGRGKEYPEKTTDLSQVTDKLSSSKNDNSTFYYGF